MGILKHLIKVFVLLVILSFTGMIYILVSGNDVPDKYEIRYNSKEAMHSTMKVMG